MAGQSWQPPWSPLPLKHNIGALIIRILIRIGFSGILCYYTITTFRDPRGGIGDCLGPKLWGMKVCGIDW